MRRLLPALATLLALAVAGCGDSSSGSGSGAGADPAKAVPANAPIYLEVVARPEGDLRTDAEAALRKVLRTDDVSAKLRELIESEEDPDDAVRWADIEKILGSRVGLFINGFGRGLDSGVDTGKPKLAIVLATKDSGKAKQLLRKDIRDDGAKVVQRRYKDVDYDLDAKDDEASAVIDNYAVIGSESSLKVAIDTLKGGDALADSAAYGKARDAVSADDGLGIAYASPQRLIDTAAKSGALGPAEQLLREAVARFGDTVAVALRADGDGIRVEGAAIGAKREATSDVAASADAVAELPDDAWLALGLGDLGRQGREALSRLRSLGSLGGIDPDAILRGFERNLGLGLQEDLLSWMGQASIYARGRSLADLGAVLTIRTTDAARSRAALPKLATALRRSAELPVEETRLDGYDDAYEVRVPGAPTFYLAGNDERVSIGVGRQALIDVAKPKAKLGDSAGYRTAAQLLGSDQRPSFLIDLPAVLRFAERLGIGREPDYEKAKPYLDVFGVLAAGGRSDGDVAHGTVAIALK